MSTMDRIARDMREGTFPKKSDATLREDEWKRLNAVFHDALAKYPHSQHALHYLWNNAIATGPESFKPPPALYICDRCGSEKNVGRVTMNMAVSTPHGTGDLPKMDQDLCPKCLNDLVTSIKQVLLPLARS